MVDPAEAIGKARTAVSQRAELPGMSLMEHLDELRRRIVHSAIYLAIGFAIAYIFHERLYGFVQAPLDRLGIKLNYTHPMDPLNLYLQVSLIGGAILASPFILYQVWLFIAPGLYQKEKRFVIPFMAATVGLFLLGASFGYFFVLPGALKILILGFGQKFNPIVTIEEYTGFFLSIILGLGISFEMPILIFFLAMFGIVSPKFLWKNIRYAILAIFLVAAIITPSPDPWTMCIYAIPMLTLYLIGIARGVVGASVAAQSQRGRGLMIARSFWMKTLWTTVLAGILFSLPPAASAQHPSTGSGQLFNGDKALDYTRDFVSIGPRWPTSPGHAKAEAFLRSSPSSTINWKKTPSPPTRPSGP